MTRPTVYKYFPDLHHIVAETAARWLSDTELDVAHQLGDAPEPSRRLRILLSMTMERLDGARIAGSSATAAVSAETAPIVLHQIEKIRRHVERILTDGLADGSFRSDLEPESDSRVLMVMLDGLRGHLADGNLHADSIGRAVELLTSSVERRPLA